jgi:hypothetical protein
LTIIKGENYGAWALIKRALFQDTAAGNLWPGIPDMSYTSVYTSVKGDPNGERRV